MRLIDGLWDSPNEGLDNGKLLGIVDICEDRLNNISVDGSDIGVLEGASLGIS